MKIKVLRELQEYIYSLKDDNGHWREHPIGMISSAKTSEENVEKIKNIIGILLASDSLSEISKIYITNRKISIKAANDILNDLEKSRGNKGKNHYTYSTTKISNDDNKLIRCFGENFLKDIVYNIGMSEKEYRDKHNNLIKEFGTFDKNRYNLGICIDKNIVDCNKYKNNEDFFEILRSLECYLIQRRKIVEDYINNDKEFVGYFNYLLSSAGTTDLEIIKDRERLLSFLNNEDYSKSTSDFLNEELYGDSTLESKDFILDEDSVVYY